MMSKSKGKEVDGGEWIIGYYVVEKANINHEGKDIHYIFRNNVLGIYRTEVIPESVTQIKGE